MCMYKLTFFVPEEFVEEVKATVFAVGAGRIGDYDCCSWQVLGEGQFRPLKGAKPFLGQVDEVEKVVEYRVEMVCADDFVASVVKALKLAHPYETPAYDLVKLNM